MYIQRNPQGLIIRILCVQQRITSFPNKKIHSHFLNNKFNYFPDRAVQKKLCNMSQSGQQFGGANPMNMSVLKTHNENNNTKKK